jgi:hypothetical protein
MDSPGFRSLPDRLRGGSRRFPPNRWSLEETVRNLRYAAVEWAYVFDMDGRQLFRRRGTRETGFFAANELSMLRDSIVVHNHPLGPEEVPEALTFAVRYDVVEMRLVSIDWSFMVRRPGNGWPVDDDLMGVVLDETRMAVNLALRAMVLRRLISDEEREHRVAHETMRQLASW